MNRVLLSNMEFLIDFNMIEERILDKSDLSFFLGNIKKCFLNEGFNPTKRHLEMFYDYVRLNENLSLDNPQKVFYEVLNEKNDLLFFEINCFEEVDKDYGFSGKSDFIKIKLLEIEIYVQKHKLYLSHLGKNF